MESWLYLISEPPTIYDNDNKWVLSNDWVFIAINIKLHRQDDREINDGTKIKKSGGLCGLRRN